MDVKHLLISFAIAATLPFLSACPTTNVSSGKTELTYTEIQGDQTAEIISTLGFADKLRNIELHPMPVPTAELDFEPFVLGLSTGSPAIDVYLLDAPWIKRYSSTNWLRPIDVNSSGMDISAFRKELIDVTSIGSGEKRKILALPFETKGNLLFYRKDLLAKNNLEPPQTWDELFAQCQLILGTADKDRPRYGFVFHGKFFMNDFYPIMWGFGGNVSDEEGNLTINRAENVRALAMVKRMMGTISPSADEMEQEDLFYDYKAVDRIFAEGNAIFMINWNIRWGDLKQGIEGQSISIDQVGVAPIPSDPGQEHYSNIGSFGWAINFSSENPHEAQQFIQLITSFEAQKWRAVNSGIIPSRLDVLNDPVVRERAADVLNIARVFEGVQLKARPFQSEINDILDEALIAVLSENLDPLQVLTAAENDIKTELEWISRKGKAGRK